MGSVAGVASAVEVQDLHKSYGDVDAVRGVSFTVEAGEIVAVLGPNGAAVSPVWHLNKMLEAVFNPNASGTGIIASHVAVLLAWGVGALVVATLRFRWEPRTR